ncbi:MAG: S8 family serine peptidase [Moorea sp. SIO1F2]|uniref:S8 family serine peptidase n=1 Tax=Moorena sp. SIO1F2 TaxID=2607819 RepID=UPI0013BDA9D0|nr:S8 family serine peptidase [Moorena sp. SIO1F2]NET85496.1 S8 family serine peptidase [Moorena sp. SIO1F2]
MRVLIQMRFMPELRAAMTAESFTMTTEAVSIDGFSLDQSYTPVLVPNRQRREQVGVTEVGRLFSFDARPEVSTYLLRGEVADEALEPLIAAVEQDPNAIGVFSDPRISAIAICPTASVGTHRNVENLLQFPQLQAKGMDGSNVMVAIVDSGVNLSHLNSKGKTPQFDGSKSWTPVSGLTPGNMPVGHGTMCAFDVCIAAPNSTLLDYALFESQTRGGSLMDGLLSDGVKAFSNLLQILSTAPEPKPALVVNNSWGMFHPSWDFPVGHPGNYSDNPNHPFNIIVESLEDAGADILFAAGNCGAECPDGRCQGVTNRPIYGANSHPSVLCIAGVTVNKERVGYSSQGPGHLDSQKPDLCAYTHFVGSGVYPADSGTSAACPVAAGVVASIRTKYPPSVLSPAELRQLLRRTAEDLGVAGFDYDHGFGLIDVPAILNALERIEIPELQIGEAVSGHLKQTGDSSLYRVRVGTSLSLELDGPDGVDFDLYVRKALQPTISEFDYRGYTSLPDEKISIRPSEPGEYFVMVRSFRGAGDFSLKASVESILNV